MALWLVRVGRHGEHEEKFLQDKRAYLTWRRLNEDLSKLPDKSTLPNARNVRTGRIRAARRDG